MLIVDTKVDADVLSHDWLHDTCNRHDAARYSVPNGSVPALYIFEWSNDLISNWSLT